MRRMDLWKLSLLNVFAAPLRSMLTVLGMAIGIGAILAVVTLGDAGKTQVRSEMARLGIDKVWITGAQETMLQQGDGNLLAEALQLKAAETVYASAEAVCGEREETAAIVGCEAEYLHMTGVEIVSGRMLYPVEWEADGRGLLLGENAAKALAAAAGDIIELFGRPFLVRGIVRGSDAFSRVDPSEAIFVPVKTLYAFIGTTIHEIMLDVPSGMLPQTAAAMASNVLANRRGLNVETMTLQVQMEAADSVIETFVEVLKWVALVCVLVGGIGVMNILLVSVRERRREIGIMKSLGATHRQICTLFLLEAVSYALLGGVLGVGLGHMLISIAGLSIGLAAQAEAADCICVFLAAVMIGVFFGVMPASRAAALTCVDALQEE